MEQSSYLFKGTRNYRNIFTKMMEKQSVADSNMSIDSLDISQDLVVCKLKPKKSQEELTETILVPFYENDVLIKVPKKNKKKQQALKNSNKCENTKNAQEPVSYLVNKNKNKGYSYLETFQKQFLRNAQRKREEVDIRSISPEFGDTDIGSISEYANSSALDFYNTEAYNEIYYEKLLNHVVKSFENSLDDGEVTSKSLELNNLKSVSEITPPRRARRTTVPPIQYAKLGGLGPDMEKIRPRLERAKSLQRYSEKVRMENRLKIYKLTLEEEEKRKAERDTPRKRIEAKAKEEDNKMSASYLINKQNSAKGKPTKKPKAILSTVVQVVEDENDKVHRKQNKPVGSKSNTKDINCDIVKTLKPVVTKNNNKPNKDASVKDSKDVKSITNKQENKTRSVSPMDMNYLTNMETDRNGSSTLRSLEEKHRMFQEQVKGFTFECRN